MNSVAENIDSPKKSRLLYLDIARTIAIISISLNHAVNRTYDNYGNQHAQFLELSTASNILKTVITVFSRIGVPLFLMITGALILSKTFESNKDLKKFYKHNYIPMLITTEIWYIIMYFVIVFFNPTNTIIEEYGVIGTILKLLSTMSFLKQFTMGSMWYMPMILCIYTILPFLAVIIKKFSKKYIAFPLLITFFVSMILPAINQWLIFQNKPTISTVLDDMNTPSLYLIYIFVGYCISKGVLNKINDWIILLLAITTFVTCCIYQFYAYYMPQNYLVAYSSPGILITAIFTFEFLRRKEHWFKMFSGIFAYISKISFGIYFVHIVIVQLFVWHFDFSDWALPLKMIFIEVVSVGGSILIISIFSRIKLLKKYLFMIKN